MGSLLAEKARITDKQLSYQIAESKKLEAAGNYKEAALFLEDALIRCTIIEDEGYKNASKSEISDVRSKANKVLGFLYRKVGSELLESAKKFQSKREYKRAVDSYQQASDLMEKIGRKDHAANLDKTAEKLKARYDPFGRAMRELGIKKNPIDLTADEKRRIYKKASYLLRIENPQESAKYKRFALEESEIKRKSAQVSRIRKVLEPVA